MQAHRGSFHWTSHRSSAGPVCVPTMNYFRRCSGPEPPWILPYNPQHLFYVQCWPTWESASIGCHRRHRWANMLTEHQLALCFPAERAGHKWGSSLNHLQHRGNTCLDLIQNKCVLSILRDLGSTAAVQITELWVCGSITYSKFLGLMLTCTFAMFGVRMVLLKLVRVLLFCGLHTKFHEIHSFSLKQTSHVTFFWTQAYYLSEKVKI